VLQDGYMAPPNGSHCYVFWPNFLKCDPLLVLSVFSQGVVFQEIRLKKRAMMAAALHVVECTRRKPPGALHD
jgi:hypothetical protein